MNVQKTSFPALWVKILNTWQHTKSEQRKLGCNWQCTQFWGRHTQQQKNVTKKIKLSITWPVIHSVSVGLPPHTAFSISKTTSVRNEPDQCKNTDSLPSKVFTHVLVHLVAVYQTCLGPKKETKTNKKSLILKSGEKGAALSPPPPLLPRCKAASPAAGDGGDVFIQSVKCRDQRMSSTGIIAWWGASILWGAVVLCSHLVVLLETNSSKT